MDFPRDVDQHHLEADVHEPSLRPLRLCEYIGQSEVKDNLSIFIQAAKKRGTSLDHVLFSGPPGLGKTTLATILANELEVEIYPTSGPVIERQGDLAAILTNLKPKSLLFIDEIHRMNRVVEEVLYSAMEDFKLDILIGQGPSARTVKLDLAHFTLVGATTRAGLLSTPLRDRFGIPCRLEFYTPEELCQIVLRSANQLRFPIEQEAALELAKRSRGTPRIANRLLKRCRDFAEVAGLETMTASLISKSLNRLNVDSLGLDRMDQLILRTMIEKFGGGPVGLNSIAAAVSEEADTLEDVYEPYLLLIGFLQRTPRGRVVLPRAYEHLGLALPHQSNQLDLLDREAILHGQD